MNCTAVGRITICCAVAFLASATCALADLDWSTVPVISHSTYQAVNANGTSGYVGGFPIRLRGVVLNNSEDWLDPTAAYDSGVTMWEMGGESEIFVQAVWDQADPYYIPGDFGGTAAWMGQNYGNHISHQDPIWNYTDAQWTAELGRLNLFGGDGVTDPIRAGDLVEIRARGGLHYAGKMNVNEQHDNDFDREDNWDGFGSPGDGQVHDFEVVLLQADYGLPAPTAMDLRTLKDDQDAFLFDPTRQTGGERYQCELVRLNAIELASPGAWASNTDLTVTDVTGRTLSIHLGRDTDFDAMVAPTGTFAVTGILDQKDPSGVGGYRLLVMDPETVQDTIAGDVDGDNDVDLTDLAILAGNWDQTTQAGWSAGDFNLDSAVNLTDLAILASHWSQATAVYVPEPTALALLGLGGLGLRRCRR